MPGNKEIINKFGMNPKKPDSFQLTNEPLMNNIMLWSGEQIELSDLIQSFFNVQVKTKLVAILLDLDPENWIGFAASWQQNNQTGQIRIDSKLTEFLLDKAFGKSSEAFDIKKINQLELNILQTFLQNLESKMKEFWEIDSKHPYLMDTIYLVWLVESDEGEIGRLAFGMPASFKPKKLKTIEAALMPDINKLANTGIKVPINLKVGSTHLSLCDIKTLEKDDLLVFEESNSKKLSWHFGEISLVLPEEEHPIFLKNIGNIEELAKDMTKKINVNDDPLSTLPLELSAEFQKVSIPLKQVLELKAGGVLPLGSVLDSELILTAQGKPVAKGELVIVGNQFGMRITDLLIGSQRSGKTTGSGIEDLLGEKPKRETKSLSFDEELKDIEET